MPRLRTDGIDGRRQTADAGNRGENAAAACACAAALHLSAVDAANNFLAPSLMLSDLFSLRLHPCGWHNGFGVLDFRSVHSG